MKKTLWISPYVPYDKVPHAGGKTHNYYIKYFQKSNLFDIHLITLAQRCQREDIDLDRYGIANQVVFEDGSWVKNFFRKLYNVNSVFNDNHYLCQTILSYQFQQLKNMVVKYSKECTPEVVIMQWTGTAFLLPIVKKLFPNAYTVIIEEDVTFLGYERRYKETKDINKRKKQKKLYEKLKMCELQLLEDCSLVVVNNEKDCQLLRENGIASEKIYVATPYYEDYSDVKREKIVPKVIFLGVMSRNENHDAAMWMIRNVMTQLQDTDIKLEIIGSNPKEELKQCVSEKVCVRGYVEDIHKDFSECLCMAVPLRLGAGIKVKILEGMSAGIPVLTNSVGIEGIPAKADVEYCYCESSEEYVTMIRRLYESEVECYEIGDAAKRFMKNTYNIDKRLDGLMERIQKES
ncbi:MAG: glycosyltransferase [Lachnospiraceae bacterium]|nr:glycosyltransferase [Lachnospiraceae bacterium]